MLATDVDGGVIMAEYINIDKNVIVYDTRGGAHEVTVRHILSMNRGEFEVDDVRPVVLCRDCIFRSNEWTGCPKLNGTITGDEFFCKCGIKREGS